jgi:chemotaxis protein methyltransferase CheR
MSIKPMDFDYLSKLVRDRSAIVLEPGKEYLLESRLLPLARREGFTSIEGMVAGLRAHPTNGIARKVVEAMTTNETSFFRDITPFEALKNKILPEMIERRGHVRFLNIWSAACSSGQEAYSLAMMMRESFPSLDSWNIRILATDISQEMLERTRLGIFNQIEVSRGLPASMLAKYFDKRGTDWQIKPALRQMIDVRELNLAGDWGSMSTMDLVFIRNVMIYFDIETKKTILNKVKNVLRQDGYLFLGGSETTLNLDGTFSRLNVERAVCYQLANA